jgi:DNA-binding transcriptional MerR regulator
MRINEVCSQIGTTKKAINWYESQGLIHVSTDENGYRNFSDADVSRIKEIHLLRLLDISAKDIKSILDSKDKQGILRTIRIGKQMEAKGMNDRLMVLDKLIANYDLTVLDSPEAIQLVSPVEEKLILAFPGFWGEYLAGHFSPYLQEVIKTPQQAEAYECMVQWLDNAEVKLPLFLKLMQRFSKSTFTVRTVDPEQGINKIVNADEHEIKQFIETVHFQQEQQKKWRVRLNPVIAFVRHNNRVMRERLTESGYYDTFIPALRRLSSAYNAYCSRLEELDKLVME